MRSSARPGEQRLGARRREIAEPERLAPHALGLRAGNRPAEGRRIMDESVVLAALAARVGIARQLCHEAVIELASAETPLETVRIDAHDR